jgi:hypothetical protein
MTISSQTVSVSISLGTRAPAAANFGTPAIFCQAPFVGSKLYELSSEGLAAMVTDGFSASSGVYHRGYQLASIMAAQTPHTSQVRVFARTAANQQEIQLIPLVTTEDYVYNFSVQVGSTTTDITYTVLGSATTASVVTALQALLDAVTGVDAADDTTHVTITPSVTNNFVALKNVSVLAFSVLDVSPNASIETDLAAAAADVNAPFYRFVIDSYSEAENNAAGTWANANGNLFFAQSADTTNVVDAAGTGVGQDFFTAGYDNAAVWHSQDMAGCPAAAIVAREAAFDPGTSAYHYQQPSGAIPDALTATHLANAKGKNVNLYAYNGATPHTWYGVAASGRSLRVQSAIHLMEARIQEAVLAVFLSSEFVPMSVSGFGQMEAAVRGVLGRFARNGVILPLNADSVTVPSPSDLSAADLVAGVLNSLKFVVTMPNDMQKVVVNGKVSF